MLADSICNEINGFLLGPGDFWKHLWASESVGDVWGRVALGMVGSFSKLSSF